MQSTNLLCVHTHVRTTPTVWLVRNDGNMTQKPRSQTLPKNMKAYETLSPG